MIRTVSGVLLPSASRSGNADSAVQTNLYHRGVLLTVKITAVTSAGDVRVDLRAVSEAGDTYNLADTGGEKLTTTGRAAWLFYPGVSGSKGTSDLNRHNVALPRLWRVRLTHGSGAEFTSEVEYQLLP